MGLKGNEDLIEYGIEILPASLILLLTIVICLRSIYLCRKFKFGIGRVWESISLSKPRPEFRYWIIMR